MRWPLSPLALAAFAALAVDVALHFLRVAPIGAFLAFAIYFIGWWVCLFAVLPFGVRTQSDAGEVIQGTSAGAPVEHRMGRVFALTTIVSTVAFAVLLLALRFKVVPLG